MRSFWKIPVLGAAAFDLWRWDARRKREWMAPHLPGGPLLEIGSGPGSVLFELRRAEHKLIGVDIRDSSYNDSLRPILSDGGALPFADKTFSASLLLTTLHHARDPERLIREAARVARRILIIEDIYRSPFHRRMTKIADAITNLEFVGHPHANRDDAGWRATFDRLGLRTIHASEKPMAGYFLQALYVVEQGRGEGAASAQTSVS
ncbi:MAG: class I SAM-dependent methyltransferase [Pseudomonadota bacterium]